MVTYQFSFLWARQAQISTNQLAWLSGKAHDLYIPIRDDEIMRSLVRSRVWAFFALFLFSYHWTPYFFLRGKGTENFITRIKTFLLIARAQLLVMLAEAVLIKFFFLKKLGVKREGNPLRYGCASAVICRSWVKQWNIAYITSETIGQLAI